MVSVILMMAGSSSRMNGNENKLFLPLGNKMVFQHSLDLFLEYNFNVICVTKEEYKMYLNDYSDKVKIVLGGNTRQESVFNGLKACQDEYVFIHDAARPFISKRIIDECLQAIGENSNFLVATKSKDSVYLKTPLTGINRDNIVLAQTPQGGLTKDLLNVHIQANNEEFVSTDDVTLLLKYLNAPIKVIDGEDTNFKITTQLDYILAKELIK